MPAFTAHLLNEGLMLPARSRKGKEPAADKPPTLKSVPLRARAGSARAIPLLGEVSEGVEAPSECLPELVHLIEEVLIGPGQLELVQEELHGLDRVQLGQGLPEQPDLLELVLLEEQLLLARACLLDVDRREDPLVHQAPVQVD